MTPFIPLVWTNGAGWSAVLPTIPGSREPYCLCYDDPGGHGDCLPTANQPRSRPATDEEAGEIAATLELIGYESPRRYRRCSSALVRQLRANHRRQSLAVDRYLERNAR